MSMVAGQLAQLPKHSKVLELGAGSSDLENLVKKNFNREDIMFTKVDGDKQYEAASNIIVSDTIFIFKHKKDMLYACPYSSIFLS